MSFDYLRECMETRDDNSDCRLSLYEASVCGVAKKVAHITLELNGNTQNVMWMTSGKVSDSEAVANAKRCALPIMRAMLDAK